MKFKYFALIPFLLIHLIGFGQQVPNAGFETWTNSNFPDGWYTFSSGGFVDLASEDNANKVEGNSSAKIQTGSLSGQTVYEILSLGTATFSFNSGYSYFPIYFPFRPDTFHFAYTFNSPSTDTAIAYIRLSKGNTILLEKEIDLLINAQWTFPTFVLSSLYPNADIPDSLLIQFKSSKTNSTFFGIEGSKLHIDDVQFGYSKRPLSSIPIHEEMGVLVRPNPFTNQIHFSGLKNLQTTVYLYNTVGECIFLQKFSTSITIQTDQLKSGIYYYELRDSNGIQKSGKIIKQ